MTKELARTQLCEEGHDPGAVDAYIELAEQRAGPDYWTTIRPKQLTQDMQLYLEALTLPKVEIAE